jgi:ATP-dependent exoDNAse (exonuclease V) alpha subunit
MASVTDLARLLRHVEQAGAKAVLTGEDKQLDAITHGGTLRHLSRDPVVGASRIETVVRQREKWARDAVIALRDGRAREALDAYDKRGLIKFGKGAVETRKELVKQWKEYVEQNSAKKSVILATRNEDVRAISAEVRSWLQEQGKVGREDISLKCLHGGKAVETLFSVGDHIKFGRNDPRLGGVGVINGTLATVESVRQFGDDVKFRVRTDEGKTVEFLASEYVGMDEKHPSLSQAYALTVFSSQGITVDGDVFLYGNGMDRALSYVATSRAKDSARIFVDELPLGVRAGSNEREELMRQLERDFTRDNRKMLAVEYLHQADAIKMMDRERAVEMEVA